MFKQGSRYLGVGLEMGIAVFVGIWGGRYLDEKFDTEPFFFWFGMVIGIGAAAKAIIDAAKSAQKEMMDNGSSPPKKD
ncbi:MAG: AtpZ/AtpI family protein [Proteobacteria bacterium]|nr:AtpZ/AtpI family protein [Pseudomonadota bacterium]